MSQKNTKPEAKEEMAAGLRPIGLSFSSYYYGAAGAYYLVYPLLQDPSLVPLYVLGALSVAGSFGIFRMTRWGLWLGFLLFPAQIIAPAFALQAAVQQQGFTQNSLAIAFAASLVALIIFATLAFLLVLDKRKIFK